MFTVSYFLHLDVGSRILCLVTVDEETVGTCDNTSNGGDCGYRNTGCGSSDWTLFSNITDDVESDGEGSTELVSLLTNRTESCPVFICLPCLKKSGFAISASKSSNSAESRKKRALAKKQFITSRKLTNEHLNFIRASFLS